MVLVGEKINKQTAGGSMAAFPRRRKVLKITIRTVAAVIGGHPSGDRWVVLWWSAIQPDRVEYGKIYGTRPAFE